MERFTKKQKPIDLLGDGTICNYGVPNHNEFHTATAIANKLGKFEDLEEELGCPIEIRLNVNCDTKVYDEDGVEYNVDYIYKNNFICHNGTCDDYGIDYEFTFYWKDYKKNWWFKKDRSE